MNRTTTKHGVSSNPLFLTPMEAAFRLGVRPYTVRHLFAHHLLSGFRVGRTIRIHIASVEDYIKKHSNVDADTPLIVEGGSR